MSVLGQLKLGLKTTIIMLSLMALQNSGVAAYMTLQVTPYDKQMADIQNVLHLKTRSGVVVDYSEVMSWMRQIRNYQYSRSQTWNSPERTEKRRAGDCKDKALLLLSYFKKQGCGDVKLIIGKQSKDSRETHAWVEWKHNGQWIILDPTFDRKPILDPGEGEYIEEYAFIGGRKYAYASDEMLLAGL